MPKQQLKVKDNPGLVRDSFTKAVLNTDRSGFNMARKRKKHLLKKESELDYLRETIATLLTQQEELKKMILDVTKK
jgi:flagellar motility protein MotE (MotC chaperone)